MDTTTTNGQSDTKVSPYLTPAAVVIGAVIIAFAIGFGDTGKTLVADPQVADTVVADISKVKVDATTPVIGNPNAPLTIVIWEDYQCPVCRALEVQSMGQIYQEYVVSGKVRLIFKEFEFLGPDSLAIAEFGHAVWKLYPQSFYAWHSALFANQGQENTGWATRDVLVTILGKVPGIDANKVAADVDTNKAAYDALITAGRTEATELKIKGTPALFIGSTFVGGLASLEQLKAIIEKELAKVK